MKKILTFIICVLLVFSASACTSFDLQENDVTSTSNTQTKITLLRALTGSDEISSIKSLSINYENNSKTLKITDIKDWEFLKEYVYSNTISFAKKEKLTNSGKTNLIKIGLSEQEIYLLKDGTIIKQEMCGDSGVKEIDRSFEIYKAEEKYMLNQQKLADLLKKYDAANITSQKETVTSSNNDKKAPVTSSKTNNSDKKEPTTESKLTLKNSELPEVKFSAKDSNVRITDMLNLDDGGFAAAGVRITEDYIYSIIQTYDKNSNFIKEYSFENGNGFDKIAVCSDGGFFAASYGPPCITKINENFETEWFMPYEDVTLEGNVQDILEISPGCLAVLFVSRPYSTRNLKLSFLNKDGTLIETIELIKNIDPCSSEIIADGKGGFYLLSSCNGELVNKYPLVAKNYDSKKENEVAIMHFSSDKELTWVKTIGGIGDDWLEEAEVDTNGNFYVVLGTNSPKIDDFWEMNVDYYAPYRRMLVKLDKNGNLIYKVPLSNKGMAAKQTFGIHIKGDKTYVVGMSEYFDGYQDKYLCKQIPPQENGERIFCVFNACIDSNGKELGRDMFRCDINDTPCDSVLLPNGSLVVAGRVSSVENPFNLEFPSGIDFLPSLFIF